MSEAFVFNKTFDSILSSHGFIGTHGNIALFWHNFGEKKEYHNPNLSPQLKATMKKYLLLAALALTVACKKNDKVAPTVRRDDPPAKPELLEVKYELRAGTVEPFLTVGSSVGKDGLLDENGQKTDWDTNVKTGILTKKTFVEKGAGTIVFFAIHLKSDDFSLTITTKYDTVTINAKDYHPSEPRNDHYAQVHINNSIK